MRIEHVNDVAVHLDGPRYPDIAPKRRVEGSGDRGLTVAGRARDKQAASAVGHRAEHLKRGLGQDEVGQGGSEGVFVNRQPLRFLALHHRAVGAERDWRGADVGVQVQETAHALSTAIEHRIPAIVLGKGLPDLNEVLAVEMLEQDLDHVNRQGELLGRPLRGGVRVCVGGLERQVREEAEIQPAVFRRRLQGGRKGSAGGPSDRSEGANNDSA